MTVLFIDERNKNGAEGDSVSNGLIDNDHTMSDHSHYTVDKH